MFKIKNKEKDMSLQDRHGLRKEVWKEKLYIYGNTWLVCGSANTLILINWLVRGPSNKLVLMRAEIQCSERDLKSQNTNEGHLIHSYNDLIPQEYEFFSRLNVAMGVAY